MLGGSIYDWKIPLEDTGSSNISGTSLAKKPVRLGPGALGFCGLLHAAAASAASGQPEWSPKAHDFPVGTKKTWSETTLSKSKKRTTTNH